MRETQSRKEAGSRRRRSAREIAAVLAEYAQSGLTQRVYAQEAGIALSTLQYWLRKEEEAGGIQQKARFSLVEVEVEPDAPIAAPRGSAGCYEIVAGKALVLRVTAAFCTDDVRRLLTVMKEVEGC